MSRPRHPQPRLSNVHQEQEQQQQQQQQRQQNSKPHASLQEENGQTKVPNSHQSNNQSKSFLEDEQIKFHQKLLQAQKKSANELLKTTVPGLLSPKLFSAGQVEAMQLMQAHQVQAQMQQVYQQVTL